MDVQYLVTLVIYVKCTYFCTVQIFHETGSCAQFMGKKFSLPKLDWALAGTRCITDQAHI